MILFSDRGTPDGYHHQHGYSGHTFKFVNKEGKFNYVQIHVRKEGGFKTLTDAQAGKLAGENPDYGIQSLFEDIEKGAFPQWTVYVQTMTPEQAEKFRYNILDLTKVWPHAEFPLRPIGKIVLNKNVENYFAEIEQAAFSPSHLVPGIEPSADPVLQSRLFSYPDTHRHRLGTNYGQLPVNAPIAPVANFQRDGAMAFNNQGSRPNYQSSILPLNYQEKPYEYVEHEVFLGAAQADLSEITARESSFSVVVVTESCSDIDCAVDFEQPRALWSKVFSDTDKDHFVSNVAGHLGNAKSAEVKARQRMSSLLQSGEISLTRPWPCSVRIRRCRPDALRPHRRRYQGAARPAPLVQACRGGHSLQVRRCLDARRCCGL